MIKSQGRSLRHASRGIAATSGRAGLSFGRRSIHRVMDVAVRNGLLAFLAPFLIYVLTAAPTIYNLDSAELTTAAATGGLMRATGYPLYLVLGKLWSLIPVGDLGYRMNLFSAFWGAVTIFLADYILKLLKVRSWARFGALGLLATAPYFWSLSLFAEVYTLHTALMAGIILALLRWGEDPGPARLGLVVFLLAISMGNHAATVLLLPGSLWYVGTRHPQELRRSANYLAVLLALILGGSVFLYLPWRYGANPPFNYAGIYDGSGTFQKVNLQTLDGFLWLVTGRTFSGQMFGYRLHELGSQALEFGNQLWLSFFAIGILPGLIGLFYGIKRVLRHGYLAE